MLLLSAACRREDAVPNDAPPIMGFGELAQSLDVTGSTTVTLYLSKPVQTALNVPVKLEGTALAGEDYAVVGESVFHLEPGDSEAVLTLEALPTDDGSRLDRVILLTLDPTPGLRLEETRRQVEITFNLNHTVELSIWAPNTAFPRLNGYTSFGADPVPEGGGPSAGEHFVFAYASRTTPNVIGFYNQTPGANTNAFNLTRIYAEQNVSSGSANIRIPEALRFRPAEAGAAFGTVEVIPQRVTITRTTSSGLPPFTVGISGSGTYDESTQVIELDVYFDETEIGGGPNVLRRYVYTPEDR